MAYIVAGPIQEVSRMGAIGRFYRILENTLSGVLLVSGLAVLFYGVLMRYVFNAPQAWIDEVSRYLVVWGTLIGAAVALREDRHIKVEILYDFLPEKMKPVVDLFANGLGVVFSSLFMFYGLRMVQNRFETQQLSIDVGIPLWIVYLVIPISGLMWSVRFLERIFRVVRILFGKVSEEERRKWLRSEEKGM